MIIIHHKSSTLKQDATERAGELRGARANHAASQPRPDLTSERGPRRRLDAPCHSSFRSVFCRRLGIVLQGWRSG
jgi:hypothetical protein